MSILTYLTPRGRHRAPRKPLRLTRRGRIVRAIVGGAVALGGAMFAQQLSVGFFTVLVWAGNVTGLAA